MPRFVKVCRADEIADGAVRRVEADGTALALCRRGDQLYALSNFCPHLTGNLGEGCLDGDELVCPEQFWRFKLATGRCVNVPGQAAHAVPVRIDADGWALVGI